MEVSSKWDDSRDEIMDIIDVIEKGNKPDIPIKCPICNTNNAHIYMHRWEDNRGTVWAWCSDCKSCSHSSRLKLPNWWINAEFVQISELTSHPIFLEQKVDMIDNYIMQLLKKRISVDERNQYLGKR